MPKLIHDVQPATCLPRLTDRKMIIIKIEYGSPLIIASHVYSSPSIWHVSTCMTD